MEYNENDHNDILILFLLQAYFLTCYTLFAAKFAHKFYLWYSPFFINIILMSAGACLFFIKNWAVENMNEKIEKNYENFCGFSFFKRRFEMDF